MTLLGLNLNFANIIALPLLFGLGAATSIQTILRTEKFQTLDDYFANSTTPRAIVFSLLTTLGTFFVLSLSSHVGTASMGKLLIISIFSIYPMCFFYTILLVSKDIYYQFELKGKIKIKCLRVKENMCMK